MIVTMGYGKKANVLGCIVAYGYGRRLLVIGVNIVREFVLWITKSVEVSLERDSD